jgi:hypothetical protein
MATAYTGNSHLPWWALIVALLLATFIFPFAVIVSATTGFTVDVQQLAQMLGAALVPGNPQANLYFTLYGSNTVGQAKDLAVDLKLGREFLSLFRRWKRLSLINFFFKSLSLLLLYT